MRCGRWPPYWGCLWKSDHSSGGAEVDAFVDLLVETRSQLRAERNWKQADAIRDRLEELGVVMEDSSAGTQWRFRGPQ